jgi:hypothetical protein
VPAFTYTGSDDRYYPGIGREVRPGDSVNWDADPEDGRWSALGDSAPVAPAPAPVTAPAAPAVIDATEAAPTSNGGAA